MLKHMCVVFLSLTQVAVLGVAVDQSEMSLTKTAGKSAFISCRVSGLARGNYVHWYQKKEGESFTRILYVKEDGTDLTNGPNHPKEDFTVKVNRRSNAYDLKLETLKKSHSAVYYCACWDTSSHSGTAVLGVTVDQSQLSLTKEEGKSVFISCGVSGLRTTYIHWYQKKDGEPLKRILYVQEGASSVPDSNHPEANEFTVKPNMRINTYDLRVFGSGTRLVVTDEKIKKPVVSAYQISSQSNEKSTLLCQASGMFPDLVRFTWTRSGGQSVPESDDELLEQTDTGRVTSMLIINQQKATANDYTCQVQHETKDQIVAVPDKVTGIETVKGPSPTCPPHQVQNQTEEQSKIKKPVVSAYQISSQVNGKSTLLCQASGMFPDLVRFTWTRSGGKSVPESDDELLEQTDTGRVTSMLIINQQKATANDYTCQVQHETKDQIVAVPDKVTGIEETVKGPSPTCPPHQVQNQTEGSSGSTQSLYLFRLTYAVLLVKNVLYFCSVSVLLYKRNAWSKEPPHE